MKKTLTSSLIVFMFLNIIAGTSLFAKNSESQKLGFLGVWVVKVGNYTLVSFGFKNNSEKSIKAFKGEVSIYNDFDEIQGKDPVKFSSRTKFSSKDNKLMWHALPTGHIIKPGESLYLVKSIFDGGLRVEDFSESYPSSLIELCNILELKPNLESVEKLRLKRKTAFNIDKVIFEN